MSINNEVFDDAWLQKVHNAAADGDFLQAIAECLRYATQLFEDHDLIPAVQSVCMMTVLDIPEETDQVWRELSRYRRSPLEESYNAKLNKADRWRLWTRFGGESFLASLIRFGEVLPLNSLGRRLQNLAAKMAGAWPEFYRQIEKLMVTDLLDLLIFQAGLFARQSGGVEYHPSEKPDDERLTRYLTKFEANMTTSRWEIYEGIFISGSVIGLVYIATQFDVITAILLLPAQIYIYLRLRARFGNTAHAGNIGAMAALILFSGIPPYTIRRVLASNRSKLPALSAYGETILEDRSLELVYEVRSALNEDEDGRTFLADLRRTLAVKKPVAK